MAVAMNNALDQMNAELARAAAPKPTNKKPLFLFLKEGHEAQIRPLYNLSDALIFRKHQKWSDDPDQRVNAICSAEIDGPCVYCEHAEHDKKLKAGLFFYLPVYVYQVDQQIIDERSGRSSVQCVTYKEKDDQGNEVIKNVAGIRLLELSAFGKAGDILKFFMKFLNKPSSNGTITGNDFSFSQSGQGTSKTFVLIPDGPTPMDPRIAKIIPSADAIRTRILETLPPDKPAGQIVPVVVAQDPRPFGVEPTVSPSRAQEATYEPGF